MRIRAGHHGMVFRQSFAAVFSILLTSGVAAQTAPNAGQLLQQQPKPPGTAPAEPQQIQPATPESPQGPQGPRILIKGFRIEGAVQVPASELQNVLKGAIGHKLTLNQLRALTYVITNYYVSKGYIARVILPPQEIKDGIVLIRVIEGKRGSIKIDQKGTRIDDARVKGFIDQWLPKGAPFNLPQLGEALSILNEQPGVKVKTSLAPGTEEAEINLDVLAIDQPLFSYGVGVNNEGSYATGRLQANGSIRLNNPTGHFDTASLLVNKSQGSNYVRADYGLAVGNRGLRLGVNASYLDYHLITSAFSVLDSKGTANTEGLSASYPLARRLGFNLSLTGNYNDQILVERTIAGETNNLRDRAFNLGLSGYTVTPRLGGGVLSFGANVVAGNSDERNATARATDTATRQAQGGFYKLTYNFGWLSGLPYGWNLNATLHGQFAGDNLDSAQQISLGGPYGVRAYPVGEATGDEGWLFNLDVSRSLGQALTGHLFYDAGGIRLNHSLWSTWNASNSGQPNNYTLSGVGAGMDWRIARSCLLTGSIASPLGSNPGADSNHHNVDGSGNSVRVWVALNAQF